MVITKNLRKKRQHTRNDDIVIYFAKIFENYTLKNFEMQKSRKFRDSYPRAIQLQYHQLDPARGNPIAEFPLRNDRWLNILEISHIPLKKVLH